jgi:tungstate transport system substrate-binding protein
MSNDLVLVGPRADPAGIKSTTDIVEALQMIRDKQASFISRGDRSGIHLAELALWHKDAGINIEEDSGPWYQALDVGMREALEKAAATNSYLLSDRATWLHLQDKLDLQVVLQGDRRLSNHYSAILVNPERHPTVDAADGQAFIDWLVSPEGQQAIAGYRIGGEQLFFPSAHDKNG